MKGTLIYSDPNSFEIYVKHNPKDGFLPSEESIAIEKYAQLIREQLQKFLHEKHNPMVKKLLQMIDTYNYKNNLEYKQQIDLKKEEADTKDIDVNKEETSNSNK